MTKLNQIIAVEKGRKTRAQNALRDADKALQRREPLHGLTRTYTPRDEEGEQLPDEGVQVQINATDVLDTVATELAQMFDVVATKEEANTEARADVVVDGQVLLRRVPVTTLLFLEKQLVNLRTFFGRLPQLDPRTRWEYDTNAGLYRSEEQHTTRTKKVPRNHVKWAPPDPSYKQPAQVEMYYEDTVVGDWTKTEFSGALPADRVGELVDRVEALLHAVQYAREQANSAEISDVEIGEAVFEYLLSP